MLLSIKGLGGVIRGGTVPSEIRGDVVLGEIGSVEMYQSDTKKIYSFH